MQRKTQQLFERLERRKESLCADLGSWSLEQLCFQPAPSEWSALGVLDHLVLTEKAILAMMTECRRSMSRITFMDNARNLLVRLVMWSPFKVRVPESAAAISPVEIKHLGSLLLEWHTQRSALQAFLCELTSYESSAAIFRHPVGGWTNVSGALRFADSHIAHHQYQLDRIKRQARRFAIL